MVEQLADVAASPVRGTPVRFEGELVGRGEAGYRFSEDLMFQDSTGLMYLEYESRCLSSGTSCSPSGASPN